MRVRQIAPGLWRSAGEEQGSRAQERAVPREPAQGPAPQDQEQGAQGIVINGLPILNVTNVTVDLDKYYRDEVISGPGAFVEVANDFDDFGRAFLRKLRREITPSISHDDRARRGLIQLSHSRRMNVR